MNAATETWNLDRSSGREIYLTHDRKFVARFKYANPGRSCTHFVKFLTANFTPSEYFKLMETGLAPTQVLETKGYVSFNVLQAKKIVAAMPYPLHNIGPR